MPLTSLDQIVAKSTAAPLEYWCKALDDTVYIRTISGRERDAYEASIDDGKRRNLDNFRARFVALALSDAEGNRICKDADAATLGSKVGASAIVELFEAARRHNGMADDDVQELAGNSLAESGVSGSS